MIKVSFGPQIIMFSSRGTRFSLYQSLGKNFMIPWCQSVLSNAVLDVRPIVSKLPNNSFLFPVAWSAQHQGTRKMCIYGQFMQELRCSPTCLPPFLKYTRDLICSSVLCLSWWGLSLVVLFYLTHAQGYTAKHLNIFQFM